MHNDFAGETSPENIASDAEVLSEVEEDIVIRQHRRRMFPRAALVGLGAGLVAALFRAVLAGADHLRSGLITWSQQLPYWGWIPPLAFSITGAVLSVFLVQRFAPETSGSGIPHLEAVLHRLRELNWRRSYPLSFWRALWLSELDSRWDGKVRRFKWVEPWVQLSRKGLNPRLKNGAH